MQVYPRPAPILRGCCLQASAFALCLLWMWLLQDGGAMCLPPNSRRYALPCAEGTDERVRIFIAEQVGCRVELKDRVAEIVAGHLTAGFIEYTLEAGTA